MVQTKIWYDIIHSVNCNLKKGKQKMKGKNELEKGITLIALIITIIILLILAGVTLGT